MIAIFLLSALPAVVTKQKENMELLLVQVVWRHGDRSPTHTHTSDPIREVNWTFGGGGWGQLSTIGMRQHFEFGKQLRKRYIDKKRFLSERYNSKEIYVRSSDYNRTIVSAMSNLMGMYSYNNSASIADTDYPSLGGWFPGFIPIPVHTVNHKTDFVAIAHATCKRKDRLIEMMKKRSKGYRSLLKKPWVKELFKRATNKTGDVRNEKNVWEIFDVWKIEEVHFNETLQEELDPELLKQVIKINNRLILYDNGIFKDKVVWNGLDLGLEMKKLKGGSLTNDINMHMQLKVKCLNRSNESECRWISGLKYYVYSAHDTTVFALLAALEAHKVLKEGYPDYTAAAFVELYTNNKTNKNYFKLLYRAGDVNNTIHEVTRFVPECKGKEYCELEVFAKYSKMVKPDQDMIEFCEVDPRRKPDAKETYLRNLIKRLQDYLRSYLLQE